MPWRPKGRAQVNPQSPRAFGSCDRCGFLYNLVNLNWQYNYAGIGLINKRIKVCCICLDKPSEFLKTIILPADPVSVDQPRPEPYALDENAGAAPPTGFEVEQ